MSRYSARVNEVFSAAEPTTGVRGALDSIVQSSLVDLFAAYDMAVAPSPRGSAERPPSFPDISAAVAFTRRVPAVVSGRLTLSLPEAVLELTKRGNAGALRSDWARELASQLLGRIKNRLLQFSVRLEAGNSTVIDSQQLSARLPLTPGVRVYSGRSLRGDIVVTLDGAPEQSQLVYLGPVNVASEGQAILF